MLTLLNRVCLVHGLLFSSLVGKYFVKGVKNCTLDAFVTVIKRLN